MDRSHGDDQAERLTAALSYPAVKRSVTLSGHATSVTLEQPFWDILQEIAQSRGIGINTLIAEVDDLRSTNLSSALRLYVVNYLQR